jgi:hypothetical protein
VLVNAQLCPACRKTPRRKNTYVCPGCWYTLPSGTRSALSRNDAHAMRRYQELQAALQSGTPLRSIAIR